MPNAPPASVPFSAAIVRHSRPATADDRRSQIGSTASPALASSRSAPALNVFPVPVKITPFAECAFSAISQISTSIERVREFAFSARSSVIIQISSSFERRIIEVPRVYERQLRVMKRHPQAKRQRRSCTSIVAPWRAIRAEYAHPSPISKSTPVPTL